MGDGGEDAAALVDAFLGVPLALPEGDVIGALCVLSDRPREWAEDDAQTLAELADCVSAEVGLRRGERRWQEAEETRRATEVRARAVFEAAMDALLLADDEGRVVDANPAACELHGLTHDRLVGRLVSDFAGTAFDFEAAWGEFRRAGRLRGIFRLHRPDGQVRDTEFAATADVLPGLHLSVLRDVTGRALVEEAEARLRRERELLLGQLQLRWDRMPLAGMILDADFRIVSWNPEAERTFGYSAAEAVGRSALELLVTEDVRADTEGRRERLAAGDMEAHGLNRNVTKGGGVITCRWNNTPLRDESGAVVGYMSLGEDVTERLRAEQALRESEERLRLAVSAAGMGTWDVDLTSPGRPVTWSEGNGILYGRYRGDHPANEAAFFECVHRDDRDRVRRAFARALMPGEPYECEFRVVWPDGRDCAGTRRTAGRSATPRAAR